MLCKDAVLPLILLQGPRVGSYLTLQKELSKETPVVTKQERGFIGKGCWARGSGVKEPRKTALPHGPQSHVLCCWH